MPSNHPLDNPFAPPQASLEAPEPDPALDPFRTDEPYNGPDVLMLFGRWEAARLAYNVVVAGLAYGIWGGRRQPIVALTLGAIVVNILFCAGPILAYAEVGRGWASSWAAALLCAVGVALTLVTVGLIAFSL